MSAVHSIHDNPVGQLAADHPGVVKLGRAGWFAKGLVYVVAGLLALFIAVKASGWRQAQSTPDQEASPAGALRTVGAVYGGTLLLWVLAGGMLLYAAWRVVSALMPGGTDAKAWAKRIGYVVSAIAYTTLAFTALSLTRSTSSPADGNSTVNSTSDRIMSHSGGRLLIGLVGAVIMGVGLYMIRKGVEQDVNDELDLSGLSAQRLTWTNRLGQIGEIGRGVGIGLVGFFLLRAAITFDQTQATGLDGALRRLATESWGLLVVIVVGVGFAAYGVFCLTTFTHRRLEAL